MTNNLPSLDERGQKTLYVSWSRLYEWQKCQMRMSLHMQGKGDTIKDGRRFIHGTLADRAMRRWLEQDEEHKPGQMAAYVDELWKPVVEDDTEYKINWRGNPAKDKESVRQLAKLVVNNVEPFLIKRVLPFDYHPELRFKVPLRIPDTYGSPRTVVLNGGIDIAVREPDRYSLYDLKATTNEYYISQGIMPQLIFYSIAATYMWGAKAEDIRAAFLTPACKQQYHELKITAQDRQHLMTRIVRLAHSVWDEEPPLCTKDRNECWGCDVKSHCPLFAPVSSPDVRGNHRVSILKTAEQREEAEDNLMDSYSYKYDSSDYEAGPFYD